MKLQQLAAENHLMVIPLVQTFGHLEVNSHHLYCVRRSSVLCQGDHLYCVREIICTVSGRSSVLYQGDHLYCVREIVLCERDHLKCVREII